MSSAGNTRRIRKHTIVFSLSFLFFLLSSGAGASAAVRFVSPGGNDITGTGAYNNPYRSITRGISASSPGDTLLADYGEYSQATTGENFPIVLKTGMTVRGKGFGDSIITGTGISDVVTFSAGSSNITLVGFTITGSGGGGAGALVLGSNQLLDSCRLTGNLGVFGGGISINGGVTVQNCVIDHNIATDSGGGISISFFAADVVILNNVIANNTALNAGSGHGPGIYNTSTTSIIYNNILWDNLLGASLADYYSMPLPAIPAYRCISRFLADPNGPIDSGISSNPLLINPGAGDYRVSLGSSAINNGASSYSFSTAPVFDINGTPRPLPGSALIDIGAFEIGDFTAPTGSVLINNGDTNVSSAFVTLSLNGDDTGGSEIHRMRFSNNGTAWSPWYDYSTIYTDWNLWNTLYGGTIDYGAKTVFVQYKDHAGNVSSQYSDSIILDAPLRPEGTVSITNDVGGYINDPNHLANLSLTVIDHSGIGTTQMAISNSGLDGQWSAWEDFASVKNNWDLVNGAGGTPGEGAKTVYVKFKDGNGLASIAPHASDSVGLDSTQPVSPSVSVAGSPVYVTVATVDLNPSVSDPDDYGVSKMQFSNSGIVGQWSAWEDYSTAKSAWDLTAPATGGNTNSGTKYIYARFMDPAGNISDSSPAATTIYDGSDPTGSIQINGGAGFSTVSLVSLALTNSPAVPGAVEIRLSNDPACITTPETADWSPWESFSASRAWDLVSGNGGTLGDGDKYVFVQFKDVAGRISIPYSDLIVYDATAPTGTISIAAGASNTNSLTPALTLSATDTGTSVTQMRFSNNNVLWSAWETYSTGKTGWDITNVTYGGTAGDGTKTVYVQYKDAAEHESNSYSDSILLDTTAPVGTISINSGAAYSTSTTVTLSMTGSDTGGTGMYQMRFSNDGVFDTESWEAFVTTKTGWILNAAQGTKTVYAQFKDNAGNTTSGTASDSIILDTSLPTGTISIAAGASNTNSTTPALSVSATDTGTSVTQMRFSNNNVLWSAWETYSTGKTGWDITNVTYGGTAGDGTKTVYVQYKDAAGNTSGSFSDSIAYAVVIPVYRFYNFKQGVHFYTINEAERDNLINTAAWTFRYENVAFNAYGPTLPEAVRFYRFYNFRQGAHFYTANEAEKANIIANSSWTFRFEDIAYWAVPTSASPGVLAGKVDVYRFYNFKQGVHFYTTNPAEKANLESPAGNWTFRYEGVAYKVPGP